ncbi:HAMP domain-containing protein [Butyrivibrio sp. AE3004]|uniref:HAMP domain-containing protein n=1 Tax=Butyrivibrio sp. AE3004 TaxID=1506994 RepID=UPI00055E82D2|nr:hypothetical protein [Butyrivibrio sp. AE3004]
MAEYKSYNDRFKISVFWEIIIYFLLGTLIIGAVSYISITNMSSHTVLEQREKMATNIFDDIDAYLDEYDNMDLVFDYWIKNSQIMDVEYESDEATNDKIRTFFDRNSGFSLLDATRDDIENLPEEDRKLLTEIVFNRILLRINQIKTSYKVDYVYIMAADENLKKGIFLVSGNDGKMTRSSNFGDAYTLGTTVSLSDEQVRTLTDSLKNTYSLAGSEGYVDTYKTYMNIPGYHIFLGIAYQTSDVKVEIKEETSKSTFRVVLFQLIFAVISLALIQRNVLRPLEKVQKSIESYDKKKDSAEVVDKLSNIHLGNEIGKLADSFSKMVLTVDQVYR